MTYGRKSFFTALMSLTLVSPALADEYGSEEFLNSCASCHGEAAAGDGPLAELMTVKVPALTGLSAANEGVFPMLQVIHTIDGRMGVKGHGFPMPVWGKRFKQEIEMAGPYGAEAIVRGRILSLAYYLESIQQ